MTTEYPVLDNRSINKWKVTELKEELKRRNLMTKGLKDDLVRRLDEAIHIEMEANKAEEGKGSGGSDVGNSEDVKAESSGVNLAERVVDQDNKVLNQVDEVVNQMDLDDAPTQCDRASDMVPHDGSVGKGDEVFESPEKHVLKTSAASSAGVLDSKVPSSLKIDEDDKKMDKKKVEVKDLNRQTTVQEYDVKPENNTLESSEVAADHNIAHSSNQVYDEVSPNLGFKVKSESFSTDTLTNNKKELKDNLNADNLQLDSEFVRQEIVQPSFGRDLRGGGTICLSDDLTSHGNQTLNGVTDDKPKNLEFSEKNDNEDKLSVEIPMVGQSLETDTTEKVANDYGLNQMDSANDASPVPLVSPQKTEPSVEEKFNIAAFGEESNSQDCHDFNNTIGLMDGELLEKVNLDQSSADEMEEDTLDTKLAEPDHFSPTDKVELSNDHIGSVTALSEKRKFQDVTKSGSNEPPKRQRIWNTEDQKASDFIGSDASVNRKLNLTLQTDSTTPMERVVPPSERIPTTSVRIDNFVRPFTLKAVHELLAKTGKVCSFWMDHIKTHCYVTFSSVEEAIETRNAVYNLQWPTNGGRLLIADFVDPEEVKLPIEGLSQSAGPSANANTAAVVQPAEATLQQVPKQHQEPQNPLSRVPPSVKDQLPRAASPVDEIEAPMPTLDDLFRKTKATPRIYYTPLTDKEVAAKVSRQKRNIQ